MRVSLLYCLPLLLLAASAYVQFGAVLNHDVAWFLIAAERMLDGGGYEADFFEVNLPQAFAVQIPPYLLAELPGLSPPDAARAWVFALVAQSLALIVAVQRRYSQPLFQGGQWPLWLSWLLVGLLLLPGYDFGQREHLMVVLAAPFVFMTARETDRVAVPLRAYITVLAALGFYLKPHYAVLPYLLLGIAAYRKGSWRALITLELGILLSIAAMIAAWVAVWYPGWFTIAGWTLDLYGAYGGLSWPVLLQSRLHFVIPCLIALMFLGGNRFRGYAAPLLISGVYASIVFFLQMKGWKYQFLPVALFSFLAAGVAIACGAESAQRKEGRKIATIVLAGIVGVVLVREALLNANAMRRSWTLQVDPVARALNGAGNGGSVFVFSVEMYPAFPAIAHLDVGWGSRYPTLWPLVKLIRALHGGPSDSDSLLNRYWDSFVASVAEDFIRYKPRRVLVDMRKFESALPPGDEVVALFLGNPGFAQEWKQYRRIGEVDGYRVYRRSADKD